MSVNGPRFIPVAVLVLLAVVTISMPSSADVAVGDKAPNFQLGNLNGQSTIRLSDYTTKPTLLVWWVSWCPHCQREAPIVQKIYRDLHSKGLNMVGVSVDGSLEDAKGFVEEYDITFPNAFAGTEDGEKVIEEYGLVGTPTMYVIGKGGVVKARFIGTTEEEPIRKEIAKLGIK